MAKTQGKRNESGQGRGGEAADHGASQGSGLLATLAEANGQGHHAGDHGRAGHEDRPQAVPGPHAGGVRGDRRLLISGSFGEGDQQDGVGHGHARAP